jgi:hypothetical protein
VNIVRIGFTNNHILADKLDKKLMEPLVNQQSHEDEDKIIKYLKAGYICSPIGANIVSDSIDGIYLDFRDGENMARTDGSWVWRDDLAYYVKHYHISLPEEFVEFMKEREYKASNIRKKEADIIMEELFPYTKKQTRREKLMAIIKRIFRLS